MLSSATVFLLLAAGAISISGFYIERKRFDDLAENWQMSVKFNMSTAACAMAETDSEIHLEFGFLDEKTHELIYHTSTFVGRSGADTQSHTVPKRIIERIMDSCAVNYKDDLETQKLCLTTPNIVFIEVAQTLSPTDIETAWKPAGIDVQFEMHNRNRLNLHGSKVRFDCPAECDLGWAAAKTTHYLKSHEVIETTDLPRAGFVHVGKVY